MKFVIYVPSKKGHYLDYALFLKEILRDHEVEIARESGKKIITFFDSHATLILLDIDSKDILWALARNIFGLRKTYGVSVSLETLLAGNNQGVSKWLLLKRNIRTIVLKHLKSTKSLSLISIHKNTPYQKPLAELASFITYDFQYYDLKYLKIVPELPSELFNVIKLRPTVLLFNNTSDSKKNIQKFSDWALNTVKYNFIIVGNAKFLESQIKENFIVINRYVSNGEMIALMQFTDLIYCFYNNERPSGFMGRAMQLAKPTIVPTASYLGSIPYKNSIRVNDLHELDNDDVILRISQLRTSGVVFDESQELYQYLTEPDCQATHVLATEKTFIK